MIEFSVDSLTDVLNSIFRLPFHVRSDSKINPHDSLSVGDYSILLRDQSFFLIKNSDEIEKDELKVITRGTLLDVVLGLIFRLSESRFISYIRSEYEKQGKISYET